MPVLTPTTTRLDRLVGGQLRSLAAAARLPRPTAERLREVFDVLTRESLDRETAGAYPGLSRINANGLPFQWSTCFSTAGRPASVRFLCESGTAGTGAGDRLRVSLDRLGEACRILGLPGVPRWFEQDLLPAVLPDGDDLPAHWRSALWTGVGAAGATVALKPYLNLCRDRPLDRWRRVGRVLDSLGRARALERLCELSSQVSAGSWPVGLAVDITPTGEPGRVKTYFRSERVTAAWLQRWYAALDARAHLSAVRELLDAFPHPDRVAYPDGAFVLTLEAHPADGVLSLKTDLAVTRWTTGDAPVARGTARLLGRLGLDPAGLDTTLAALGTPPLAPDRSDLVRFVGLGYEPDGSRHVNLYLEPPTTGPAPEPRYDRPPGSARRPGAGQPSATDPAAAVRRGLRWLDGVQQQGCWSDYTLPVGTADAWVTAYVLAQLPGAPAGPAGRATDTALRWLRRARTPGGGWGYNRTCDDDADSTGLAVRVLRSRGLPVPPEALAVLRRCRHPHGGVATYPPGSLPGGAWAEPTADVTATAAAGLGTGLARTADWLLGQRDDDGLWRPYWWLTPLYPTASSLDLLTGPHGRPGADRALDPTREAVRHFVPDGAFETALLLRCRTALRAPAPARHELLRELLDRQNRDGSWPASAFLRLTTPTVHEPWNTVDAGTVHLDHRGILTTATVLGALLPLCRYRFP
ncbi:hypothetical protein ACFVHB_28805 [Kitasatospora sp. NPDC127111]|uniref:hypothetical protein n=1 Tax=Kitasatospora sp. NPDC127111 TaxID=3345363 RepID=UPI00362ADB25